MKDVIRSLVDDGEFYEVLDYSITPTNIITCFAHFDGTFRWYRSQTNQLVMAGCLHINASDKSARFIRFCDAFIFLSLTSLTSPGFSPRYRFRNTWCIICHGAKMLYAYCEATVRY